MTEWYSVCCDQPEDVCQCKDTDFISWYDVEQLKEDDKALYESIYSMDSHCSSCKHWYKPSCPALRSWFRTWWWDDGEFPGSIVETCDLYEHFLSDGLEPIIKEKLS